MWLSLILSSALLVDVSGTSVAVQGGGANAAQALAATTKPATDKKPAAKKPATKAAAKKDDKKDDKKDETTATASSAGTPYVIPDKSQKYTNKGANSFAAKTPLKPKATPKTPTAPKPTVTVSAPKPVVAPQPKPEVKPEPVAVPVIAPAAPPPEAIARALTPGLETKPEAKPEPIVAQTPPVDASRPQALTPEADQALTQILPAAVETPKPVAETTPPKPVEPKPVAVKPAEPEPKLPDAPFPYAPSVKPEAQIEAKADVKPEVKPTAEVAPEPKTITPPDAKAVEKVVAAKPLPVKTAEVTPAPVLTPPVIAPEFKPEPVSRPIEKVSGPVKVDAYAGDYEGQKSGRERSYDDGIRTALASRQNQMGALEGNWVVSGAGGDRILSLALRDGVGQSIEGAWRSLLTGVGLNRSGFVSNVTLTDGRLVIAYQAAASKGVYRLDLNKDAAGRWQGQMIDPKGDRTPVVMTPQ